MDVCDGDAVRDRELLPARQHAHAPGQTLLTRLKNCLKCGFLKKQQKLNQAFSNHFEGHLNPL